MKVPINGPDQKEDTVSSAEGNHPGGAGRGKPAQTASGPETSFDEAGKLEELLKEKTGEAEAYYDKLQRLQADFENYKKRVGRERAEYIKQANEDLIVELLQVLDDLERAVALVGENSTGEQLTEGIRLIESKFKDILGKTGLQEIEALGKEFDPNYHEAVMTTPAEGDEDNRIIEELQKGYLLSEKVIRPTKVVVAVKRETSD
jgi:molecular chaperone GrpE